MSFKLTTLLICVALASAQVTVPLTDPFVFGGNGHYNETLCGGTIYLPDIDDSLSLTFNGSDFQFEFIVDPKADPAGLIVEPDDITISQGSGTVLEPSLLPPINCSDRTVYRVSETIQGQLYLGNHTATVINQGRVEYKGSGVIVSGVQYYPDPLPGLPTLSSEPGSHNSHGRNKAIIGGVIGGIIGFLALVVPAIVMIYRRRRSAKRGEVRKPQLDLLTPGDRAIAGQDGEGLAPTPAEKSENAVTTDQMATSAILQNEPQGDSVPVVLPQATQPPSSQGSKPLPSPPSTQLPLPPAQSHYLGSHLPSAPQLSPQQLRLVQELMDQGLPSSQVAGVVQSMLASGGSRNTDATPLPSETPGHVNDAPPQYDFKDRPANDGM